MVTYFNNFFKYEYNYEKILSLFKKNNENPVSKESDIIDSMSESDTEEENSNKIPEKTSIQKKLEFDKEEEEDLLVSLINETNNSSENKIIIKKETNIFDTTISNVRQDDNKSLNQVTLTDTRDEDEGKTQTVVSKTGKYVTLDSLNKVNNQRLENEKAILSKWDFKDKNFKIMNETVGKEGFRLHPLYYKWKPTKNALPRLDPKVIGVRIKDDSMSDSTSGNDFDISMFSGSNFISNSITIMEAVDVGGVDYGDYGIIKL